MLTSKRVSKVFVDGKEFDTVRAAFIHKVIEIVGRGEFGVYEAGKVWEHRDTISELFSAVNRMKYEYEIKFEEKFADEVDPFVAAPSTEIPTPLPTYSAEDEEFSADRGGRL